MTYFILVTFVVWRIFLFLTPFLSGKLLTFSPRFPYSDVYLLPSGLPKWIWSFANFDGVHYLTISKEGYSAQFTQVFFPLYPIIIRFFSELFYSLNPILIGLITTNGFFLLTIFVFYKLMKLDYKDKLVCWSVLFLVFFPTSFFFGSLYTESLFMLLILLAFYMARRKKWWFAGALGGLASLTRLIGVFLLPALLWERKQGFNIENGKFKIYIENFKYNKILKKIYYLLFTIYYFSPLYLVPLGLIAYMIYLQIAFGDWLYFWHVQPVFGAERSGQTVVLLPQVLFRYFKILISTSYVTEAFWIAFSELFFTLFAIFILIIGHKKKVKISYLIFSWSAVIVPTLTGTFSSMPRYILVAFPIYIILGMIKSRLVKSLILVISLFILIILTVIFTRGRWVA